MKEAPFATAVDGEGFSSDLSSGYKASAPATKPFVRFLPHIAQRRTMVNGLPQAQDNYETYDGRYTVNLS